MLQSSVSQRVNRSKRLVSIKDIAKEAGVSVCTVSLVMNNKDHNRVSKAVAQRVRETAQSMGYKPNSVARTLRTSRSYVLGFITDEIATTPYAGRVLVGAQEAARKLGYILLTVNTGNDRELENQEIAALRQYRVDGFLYAMMYHRVVEIPAELEGSPTVVVDSEDENRKIPSIYPDDEMAGYDATNRLIQAGCKRIVYYGSSITIIAQGERFAGYRRALADAGIPFDEQLVVNVEEATNAASEAGRVFDEIKQSLHEFGVDFDVYFHENDLHTSGAVDRAIARLRELGALRHRPATGTVSHVDLAGFDIEGADVGFAGLGHGVVVYLKCCFSRLRRALLFLASPRKSKQKEGDPGSVPATPVPCATRRWRGAAELGASPLRQSSPLIRQRLRCSAPSKGMEKRALSSRLR